MKVQNPTACAPTPRRSAFISINTGPTSRPTPQTLPNVSGIQRRPRVFSTALPSLVENCTEPRPSVAEPDKMPALCAVKVPKKPYGSAGLPTGPSQKSIDVSMETDEFLNYLNNSLRLREPSSLLADLAQDPALLRVRSVSSSYSSKSNRAAELNSPASPPPDNTLRESDLLRYSRSGNHLSDLRSSSSNSRGDSTTNVVDESAAASASEWQTVPRPRTFCYNRCELIDSQEILPSDSVSQVRVADSPPAPIPRKTTKPHWFGRYRQNSQPSADSLHAIKGQYDGGGDCRNFDSPHPGAAHPLRGTAGVGAGTGAGRKRKASNLSLASISSRTRKGAKKLKVLASTVYQKSTEQLSDVKRRMKTKNEKERRKFEAWKANRKRDNPADALKGKGEPSFGAFTVDQSRHGHKDWWREGVSRYKAPSWMVFPGQRDR